MQPWKIPAIAINPHWGNESDEGDPSAPEWLIWLGEQDTTSDQLLGILRPFPKR
jgi:hypothetical protein